MSKSSDTGGSPKAQYGKVTDQHQRLTADEMDHRRKENIAYEYLCHLEEAKVWIEACINESLPPTTELEESLRNGVYLAKLGHFMDPDGVPVKKIYDKDLARFEARGLHFRHTDNINHFLKALEHIGMPKIFSPETTDIYDRKNIPRLIYCIHALSLFLFKLGKAPQIQDLYGKIKFTEEEISAMRKELEKYGIQMPAFSKIGGILANEMPVDEAALHAAIIAINEAIDQQESPLTLLALQNPAAHLINIATEYQEEYQETLFEAKEVKAEICHNKSMDPDSSYVPDVYDELLTQAELQGNINKVNTIQAMAMLYQALDKKNAAKMLDALKMRALNLREVKDKNANSYMQKLINLKDRQRNNNNNEEEVTMLSKDEVQLALNFCNTEAHEEEQKIAAVDAINTALESGDAHTVLKALKNPKAQLGAVHEFAAQLYHEELSNMKNEKQASLEHEELVTGITVLSALASINQAVDTGNADTLFEKLCEPSACIINLDETCKDKYLETMTDAKMTKQKQFNFNLLTHFEVQQSVTEVNKQVVDENDRILAVNRINEAVDKGIPDDTLKMLQLPSARLLNVDPKQAVHYQNILHKRKSKRSKEFGDGGACLWYDEIQDSVNVVNAHAEEGQALSIGVAAINLAIDVNDSDSLLASISTNDVQLHSVTHECIETYLSKLVRYKEKKRNAGECGSGWMMNRIRDGHKFYFNVHTMDSSWERFEAMHKDYSLLTRDEIQTCISEVTAAYDRKLLFKSNEKFIVKLQAHVRGYMARKHFSDRIYFMQSQVPAVVKIQSWWRMVQARRRYMNYTQYLRRNSSKIILLQAAFRRYLARKRYLQRLQFFKNNVHKIIKIQAFIRSKWAKQDFKLLMHGDNPPISVVRRFVHLLDVGDLDYAEEIELQKLKSQAVQDIRGNQQLENDLNQMDIKIGLLVKNRITLQDVVSHHKSLKKYSRDSSSSNLQGIKALSKHSRERLEAYQHLFYLLQTNPVYLAKLIFEMPQNQTNKFMESVILTLLNYASNQREEYLLLKLFKTALKEEIRVKPYGETSCKVDKMSDIVAGNPMVVKMIVSFNRNSRGQSTLRALLNPLVSGVIDDKLLSINTNPTEVYKAWVNQMETQSGKSSGMPYDVTPEQALEHQEVRDRIKQSVQTLQNSTERFLVAILQNIDKIPYGMRYMAKVLRDALRTKFPQAPEKDILKIIGNLIYYRYINSAIVAPDAFDIIDVEVNKPLNTEQRRNLGSIAKILQFAASNKGFGGESAHLSCLNTYIMDAHNRFKKYFKEVCEVEEPEMRFNMDQYTDLTRVTKPVIYISIAEIIDTHKLLLEHQDAIAPDTSDVLHELLEDLGDVPSVESLMGDVGMDENGTQNKNTLAKTEISLTLSSKFDVTSEDKSDIKSLLIRTKRMVVEVVRCQQSGENLTQILNITATEQEEMHHQALIKSRVRADQKAVANQKAKLVRQQSLIEDTKLPLEGIKEKIKENLTTLEKERMTTRKNNYQDIINSIVQDMRNQRIYRQRRKQEMVRLKNTLKSLNAKRSFYEEQIDYYNQYVKTCLENLSTKSKKSGRKFSSSKDKNTAKVKGSIKYSAAKLHEKGVVLEIEGLPPNQFKNVLFEISTSESVGIFDLNAKFMGVNMDKVELVFQDLLQLQYEGVAVMKMFDRAKVNVNLLIFLLNKKFYGK